MQVLFSYDYRLLRFCKAFLALARICSLGSFSSCPNSAWAEGPAMFSNAQDRWSRPLLTCSMAGNRTFRPGSSDFERRTSCASSMTLSPLWFVSGHPRSFLKFSSALLYLIVEVKKKRWIAHDLYVYANVKMRSAFVMDRQSINMLRCYETKREFSTSIFLMLICYLL